MCQWPNLSQDIPEMCLQGSWKPALFFSDLEYDNTCYTLPM